MVDVTSVAVDVDAVGDNSGNDAFPSNGDALGDENTVFGAVGLVEEVALPDCDDTLSKILRKIVYPSIFLNSSCDRVSRNSNRQMVSMISSFEIDEVSGEARLAASFRMLVKDLSVP